MFDRTKACGIIQCLCCGHILTSRHVHDFMSCNCENGAFVDGGYDYMRCGAKELNDIRVLVEAPQLAPKKIISPLEDDISYIMLDDHMGDDLAIVDAARKSLGRAAEDEFTDKDKKLLKYLWTGGGTGLRHTSPFEMVEFKFAVKLPIFVIRQWHRHRTWSYNEISRRYTSQNVQFYREINTWRKQSEDNKQASDGLMDRDIQLKWQTKQEDNIGDVLRTYHEAINDGMSREQAREFLPFNLYTEMVAKVDLHNLLGFLRLRDHDHAQKEIRLYAKAIIELIRPIVPETMKLFEDDEN